MRKTYYFGGTRVAVSNNGTLAFLHADHLGSASLATTSGGGIVNESEIRYYPFGETRLGGAGLPTDRRYTGQMEESAVGLYYYVARHYDPAIGRFISADTIVPEPSNPQDFNRYAYVRNNPMVYVDGDGHHPALVGGAIGFAAGAILYSATTNDFKLGECLLVGATGATAGALIGTGVGAAAGAKVFADMTVVTAGVYASTGAGMAISGGATLIENRIEGEDFNALEFAINSAGGAADGFLTANIPGTGLAATVARGTVSGAVGGLQYVMAEAAQGRTSGIAETGSVVVLGTGAAFAADMGGQLLFQGIHSREFLPGTLIGINFQEAFRQGASLDTRPVDRAAGLVGRNVMEGLTMLGAQTAGDVSVDYLYNKPNDLLTR